MSIVRIGLAETKNFSEGWDAIFGGKKKEEKVEKEEPKKEAKAPEAKTTAKPAKAKKKAGKKK